MLFKDSSGNVLPGGEFDPRDVDSEQTYGPGHTEHIRKVATILIKQRYVKDRLISAGRGRTLIKGLDSMASGEIADMCLAAALVHHQWRFGELTMTQAQAMFKLPVEDWPYSDDAISAWHEVVLNNPDYIALSVDCYEHNGAYCPLCMDIVAFLRSEHPMNLFLREVKPHGEGCRCGDPGAFGKH